MKNKLLILLALPLALAAVVLFSCAEEKDEYVCPVFGELEQDPNPAKAGEEVTLTFTQTRKGNGIESTTYTWKISGLDTDEETGDRIDKVIEIHTNYDGYGKQAPTVTFKVPENCASGTYSVDMVADFTSYIAPVVFDRTNGHGSLRIK